jgi:hypothetical protein
MALPDARLWIVYGVTVALAELPLGRPFGLG